MLSNSKRKKRWRKWAREGNLIKRIIFLEDAFERAKDDTYKNLTKERLNFVKNQLLSYYKNKVEELSKISII